MKQQHFSNILHNLYQKALKHTKYRWVVIFGTLLYLVSPLDISPDVFPILGWIDDGLIVSLLVTEVSALMADQLKHKRKSSETTSEAANEATSVFNPDSNSEAAQTITVEAVSC
ncbi:MAG: hypothetical protein HLUCCA11_10865 [Phormidesmis priestleyi Ana]|uniref:DUF1232 domain-containing protein n=1 Tax=Phormidesmis priestleyi Ana TaxID=1666911 RepID=A0A0P8C2B9_9CYAN|nr:MAG: hypothetical protein HLUCCA11_10865 [Phormidesmis priestleyi Ana]